VGQITVSHYANAQPGSLAAGGYNTLTANNVYVGGGSAAYNAATAIQFWTAGNTITPTGTTRMTIDSSGNVGIGTTSPASDLHVVGGGSLRLERAGANWYSAPAFDFARSRGSVSAKTVVAIGDSAGDFFFRPYDGSINSPSASFGSIIDGTPVSGSHSPTAIVFSTLVGNATTVTERMRISSNGNVGIGTTAPGSALEVAGQVKITGGVPGAGKVLTSDAAGLASWGNAAAGPVSGLSNATAIQTLANADFAQTWNWDTLSTQSALSLGSSSITSGKLLNATSTATGMTGVLANFAMSGNNAANTGTVLMSSVTGAASAAVPLMVTNGGTGLSLRVNDDGTDTDSTPFVVNAAGSVGIGTSAPISLLNLASAADAQVGIVVENTSAAGSQGDAYARFKTRSSDFYTLADDNTNTFFIINNNNGASNPLAITSTNDAVFGANVGIGNFMPAPTAALQLWSQGFRDLKISSNSDNVGTSENSTIILESKANTLNGLLGTSDLVNGQYSGARLDAVYIEAKSDSNAESIQFVTGGTVGATNGTAKMTIVESGYVGIGTTIPVNALDVVTATGAGNDVIRIQNTSSTGYSDVAMYDAAGAQKGGFGYGNTGVASSLANKSYFYTSGVDFLIANGLTPLATFKTNGNVGIGTVAPTGILSVSPAQYSTGTASQSTTTVTGVGTTFTAAMIGSQLAFVNGVSAGTITAFNSATSLTVSTSQTVASQAYRISYTGLNVSTTGDVGIGLTNPGSSLHVNLDNTGNTYPLLISNNSAGAGPGVGLIFQMPNTAGAGNRNWAIGANLQSAGNLDILASATSSGSPITPRMTITSTGAVGIGTTVPPVALAISGATNSAANMKIINTVGQTMMLGTGTAAADISSSSSLIFYSNSDNTPGGPTNERMRINTAGNVGIGTTAPGVPLEVNGLAKVKGLASASQTVGLSSVSTFAADGSGVILLTQTTGTNTIGTITGCNSGAVGQGQIVNVIAVGWAAGSTVLSDTAVGSAIADNMILNSNVTFTLVSSLATRGSSIQLLCTTINSVKAWVEVGRSANTN
jgi:hypothetical protein